jgi:hypothetical protein
MAAAVSGSKNNFMLIVKLKGGLGNQLFQYAFGRRLAKQRGEELSLNTAGLVNDPAGRAYALAEFNIKATVINQADSLIMKLAGLITKKVFRRFNIGYNPRLLDSTASSFEGFFSSYKYAEPIRAELLEELSLAKDFETKYHDLISEMQAVASAAVHVRRGDYVNDAKTKKIHFICDLAYYTQALALIKSKISAPVFYVFSDDIAWVKENFPANEKMVFVSGPEAKDYEELILMSRCRHNIIANSSFSFWGAWLNQNPDQIVIAPKKWNNRYDKHYQDLLPSEWLRL